MTSLSVTGLTCLALSFLGNLYMGNRIIPWQKAWKQQRELLADTSHELRKPLAVIKVNLDILRGNSQQSVASQEKWLRDIQAETDHMSRLVEALLALARTDYQTDRARRTRFSLEGPVGTGLEAMAPLAEAKGIALSFTQENQVSVYGNPELIRQLLTILLDNAIQHTPVQGRIEVNLKCTGNMALITVADTGEGIGQEHLDKIFDRFYRVDSSCSSGGAGLGLAIAKRIVEGHHGKIKVTSMPGLGTIFLVQLPKA